MNTSRIFFLAVFVFSSVLIEAQLRKNRYTIQVELFDGYTAKGDLSALNDSSIRMVKYRPMADTVFCITDIKTVSVRRRGASGRGFLAGFGIGAGMGALVGYVSYSPPACDGFCLDLGPEVSAVAGAFLGGVTGGLVGLAGASGFKEHVLNGNQALYDSFKQDIFDESRTRRQKRLARKRAATSPDGGL